MGIRFACHVCAKQLNIKQDLAGRRGICPACSSKFRIPKQDAERSLPLEEPAIDQRTESPEPSAAELNPAELNPAELNPVAKPGVEIDILSNDPDATWYVRPPSGGQYGPADGDVLRTWISEGRVAATSLLWRDGWPNWRAANEVLPGLSGASSLSGGSGASVATDAASVASQLQAPAPPQAPAPMQALEQSIVAARPAASPSEGTRPKFSGRADVGTERRSKNGKRIVWIAALSVIAILLVVVLVILVTRN